MLADSEMLQQCALATCGRWESTATVPRFKRCSKCKRRYYVSCAGCVECPGAQF